MMLYAPLVCGVGNGAEWLVPVRVGGQGGLKGELAAPQTGKGGRSSCPETVMTPKHPLLGGASRYVRIKAPGGVDDMLT